MRLLLTFLAGFCFAAGLVQTFNHTDQPWVLFGFFACCVFLGVAKEID